MKTRRVLMTGGTGLLGKSLLETAPTGWEVAATFHQTPPLMQWRNRFFPLELQDSASVNRLMDQIEPQIVIHTASVGSVDQAEQYPNEVRQINVEGTRHLGLACQKKRAFFIYISSNAVFDGSHPPYSETSPTRALNRYGQFKIEAEESVRQSGTAFLIVRPILLYGWPLPGGRSNVVTRWLENLEKGGPLSVAKELTSMPLTALDCAQALWRAAQQGCEGILHLAGPERISLVDFACRTARIFGYSEKQIVAVPSRQLGLAALRPKDTSLITTRMQSELKFHPLGVDDGLAAMFRARVAIC